MKKAGCVLAAAVLAGCAPALREPPPLAQLASQSASSATAPGDVGALLGEADASWAKRPDLSAVKKAETLYLQAAQADEHDVRGLIGAVRAKSWRIDHEPAGKSRADIAVSAVQTAQWCGRRAPALVDCHYWLAVAIGLQAREVRSTAEDGLKKMVAELDQAIAIDAAYDEAGPHRVLALVLLRAPGWPAGPGDPEKGLAEAQLAASSRPDYPPNQLALAEALSANQKKDQARETYRKAKAMATNGPAASDPDAASWSTEADAALSKLSR